MEVQSTYPLSGEVKIVMTLTQAAHVVVNVRIPCWATGTVGVLLNGQPIPGLVPVPGTFAAIDRTWNSGDVLDLSLPFSLYSEPIPDRVEYVAVKYGPLVLVALAPMGAYFEGSTQQLLDALEPVKGQPCSFSVTLQGPLRA